jgi:hypothetical protein
MNHDLDLVQSTFKFRSRANREGKMVLIVCGTYIMDLVRRCVIYLRVYVNHDVHLELYKH